MSPKSRLNQTHYSHADKKDNKISEAKKLRAAEEGVQVGLGGVHHELLPLDTGTVMSEKNLQSCLKLRNSQNPFCHILETLNKNYEKKFGMICSFSSDL